MLRVGRDDICSGALLEVLAAGRRPLVENEHLGAGETGCICGGKPSRSRTNHQHLWALDWDLLDRNRGPGRHHADRGRGAATHFAPDHHGSVDFQRAGAFVRPPVHFDQAILAHTHAAKDAAFGTTFGCAKRPDTVSCERCSEALARVRLEGLTLELDLQRQVSLRAIGHHLGHRHDGKGPHISPPPCLGINAIPPTPGLESISSSHVG